MKQVSSLITIFCLLISTHACKFSTNGGGLNIAINSQPTNLIVGDGHIISETRALSQYSKIISQGTFDVIGKSDASSDLTLTGDSNILKLVETKLTGDTLTLSTSENYSTKNPITIQVSTLHLTAIESNDSGDVNLSGINSMTFGSKLKGSGRIDLSGTTGGFDVKINGSGELNAQKLISEKAYVEINGSGDVHIHVNQNMYGKINGSGSIAYSGNPRVTEDISGSGSIRKISN